MEYKKFTISFTLLLLTLVFGTFGYHNVEEMPFFDAFYMTIITITTVGFSEIKPLSSTGRVITVIVITTGLATGTYTLGMIFKIFIEGELLKFYGRRKLERDIAKLKDHFIICGYGRIGKIISAELSAEKIPFIVIEQDPAAADLLDKTGFLYLEMDATSEDALVKAGIMNAKGLVTAVYSDANNVFISLTAKGLRPDIFILSRASDLKNEGKLKRAGASRVVSPYLIGGRRMAQVLKRPTVVDFIDIAMMESNLGLMMEEAKVRKTSPLVGKTLIKSGLRQDYGVIIVAIKKNSGEMIFNPTPTQTLNEGDILVVLGKQGDLKRLTSVI